MLKGAIIKNNSTVCSCKYWFQLLGVTLENSPIPNLPHNVPTVFSSPEPNF